jgi:hypothetical protein
MAISGSWKASAIDPKAYVGAAKWGTGVNPVHAHNDTTGRDIAPGGSEPSPEELLGPEAWGYCPEDMQPGHALPYLETYPRWSPPAPRDATGGYPSWAQTGDTLRELDHGVAAERTTGYQPDTRQVMPFQGKLVGGVEPATEADVSQVLIQTSDVQLMKPLENVRATARGTDVPRSTITPVVTGQRIKQWSTRGDAMLPVQTDMIFRPWWMRGAGTGPAGYLAANQVVPTDPIQRDVPPDPYLGPLSGQGEDPGTNYGYTGSDYYG